VTLAIKRAITVSLSVDLNLVQSDVLTIKMRREFLPYSVLLIKYIFFSLFFFLLCFFGPFPGHDLPLFWRLGRVVKPMLDCQPGGPGFYTGVYSPGDRFRLVPPMGTVRLG